VALKKLLSPYPWFGGKSKVADIVWKRFGNVTNYVEPFFGSGAVLLGRPKFHCVETINDLDAMVSNFWRSLKYSPDKVAEYSDWLVNEVDLESRHRWLSSQEKFRERMKFDPDYYDAKIAGWWVWGQCLWIGSGWCSRQLPHLSGEGQGIHRKRPHLAGDQGIQDYMYELAERLKHVRVCCGDWQRVCGPCVTINHGVTGVFLDPPYADEAKRTSDLYSQDSGSVAHKVREWAIEWGNNPLAKIALCGYEGEHSMPESWECVPWKATGGYGSQGHNSARENSHKERIWFSPHCLKRRLF